MDRLLRASLWLAAAVAMIFATLPHPPALPGEPSDKTQHILAFDVLAGLASIAYRHISAFTLWMFLALFGALIEFVQLIPELGRDSDILDWLADITASALILMLCRAGAALLASRNRGR